MASGGPVHRQETSHLGEPVSPISATGARGDDGEAARGVQDDTGSSIDHVRDAKEKGAGLTKGQKMKAHFRRFWWAYLIGFVILLIILLPLLFKVIIPKIVQDIVNDQKLPITGGALVALSPTTLNMSLDTSLNSPLAARIKATELDLYNKETEPYSPFLTITLPETKIHHKTETGITNQTLKIDDLDELIKWFNGVFDEPEVSVAVKGDPTIKLSSLSYHPSLKTEVKVKTLNYLEGFGVKEMDFVMPPAANGYNLKGVLNIPNSGSLALHLGNLSFNMMAGDVNLGLANIYDTVLNPGDNTPFFDGVLYFDRLIPNLGAILDSQKDTLAKGVLAFNATGNATVINGEHIMYVEKVLNSKHIPFELPIMSLLSSLLKGLMADDKSSLTDFVGELTGNSTLLENMLDHFNKTDLADLEGGNDGSKDGGKKVKRGGSNVSLMWNMLRLSRRTKRHGIL